ncbi:MAG: hypothetical protein Q7S66_02290 [bacterium]|nr:hypothetical protein [bacterium]
MSLLALICLFFLGLPLGLVFYLYTRHQKLTVTFFQALGVSYAVISIVLCTFLFFNRFWGQNDIGGFSFLFLLLFPLVFVIFVLRKMFRWSAFNITSVIVFELITIVVYGFFAGQLYRPITQTFHSVPPSFCLYGEVNYRGACSQDGLKYEGDGIFYRNNIFNDYFYYSLKPGRLLLIENQFTSDLDVVELIGRDSNYESRYNVIAADSRGVTSTMQISSKQIIGVDY